MTQRNWQNFFRPEDFAASELMNVSVEANDSKNDDKAALATQILRHEIGSELSRMANAILREEIAKAPVVYWVDKVSMKSSVSDYPTPDTTHKASLICVEEIK